MSWFTHSPNRRPGTVSLKDYFVGPTIGQSPSATDSRWGTSASGHKDKSPAQPMGVVIGKRSPFSA